MGQPDIQPTFNTASVEGFDQIYQTNESEAQSGPNLAQRDPILEAQIGPDQQIQPDPTDGVPLEEAANTLGLHMDTVRKRLQKGKIKGFKVADKFGEKWLVHKDELAKARTIQPHPSPEAQRDPELAQTYPTVEAQRDPELAQTYPTVEAQRDPELAQTYPTVDVVEIAPLQADPEYQRLMTIIESQAHQLKAAGDVIVYLRSEVDEAKSQIKLLTDSQHKTGWWQRFKAFFAGSDHGRM